MMVYQLLVEVRQPLHRKYMAWLSDTPWIEGAINPNDEWKSGKFDLNGLKMLECCTIP